MCGIVGLVGKGLLARLPQENVSRAEAMLKEISYRGPDGERIHITTDNRTVFGMGTLSIIPTTHGQGPFQSRDRNSTITYNGEVYNYRDLGKEWVVSDLENSCDTEVVLAGYEREGIDFVRKLQGMFAFAIHDAGNNRVVLYRDRLGQKPLYYRIRGETLAFASEIKSLLVDGPSPKHIPDEFLAFETPIGKQTMYRDVHLLEPGSYLIYDLNTGSVRKEHYWRLEDTTAPQTIDSVDQLEALLRQAIEVSTPTIPYGLMLSGGLDSAVLAHIMQPEMVFTVRYPGVERFDELEQAKQIAKAIGAKHTVVESSAEEFKQNIAAIVRHLDHPLGNSSTFSEYMVYRAMTREGLRVAVGGIGIDEFMLGYVRHLLMIEGTLGAQNLVRSYHPLIELFEQRTGEDMPDDEKYFHLSRRGPVLSESPLNYLRQRFARGSSLGQSLTQVDVGISFSPILLTADKLSSAFGMENRSPYLDHRLVEFMYWLPDDQKIAGGQTKKLFREVAQRVGVPKEIWQSRDKIGFSTPTELFLKGELRGWYERNVQRLRAHPKMKKLFKQEADRGRFDRTSFQLLCFSLWDSGGVIP